MSENFLQNAPFTALERVALGPLLANLSSEQRAWLADWLGAGGSSTVEVNLPRVEIYYGTESGNSEDLAGRAVKRLKKRGLKAKMVNLAEISPKDLAKSEVGLFVISTWGDGDPPEAVEPFFKAIEELPDLSRLSYSVCALGDSSYEKFCETGKQLDHALAKAGATLLVPRQDCDVDFDEPFDAWMTALEEFWSEPGSPAIEAPGFSALEQIEYGRKNPFPAEVIEKLVLNGEGTSKETWHLELSIEGSGFAYEVGDALALIPENDPALVDELLSLTALEGSSLVPSPSGDKPLRDALIQDFDVTTASKAIASKLGAATDEAAWTELLADQEKLKNYLKDRQLIDLLTDYPLGNVDPTAFVGCLRKLPPRLYSIASSLKAHPDEVHLTIAAVRYDLHGRQRKGVASTYVADHLEPGQRVWIYLQPNKNFRLPENPETPIIMIGPGTGVAPFRAFVEERAETGAAGDSWLFFGDQHYTYDFLYQLEWQEYLKEGVLTRLDVAFSRDQPEKVYVQHKLKERGKEIYEWLQRGAHFYVCGDASRMAVDVHNTLVEILIEEGGMSKEQAEAELAAMKKAKRYQRDVY